MTNLQNNEHHQKRLPTSKERERERGRERQKRERKKPGRKTEKEKIVIVFAAFVQIAFNALYRTTPSLFVSPLSLSLSLSVIVIH